MNAIVLGRWKRLIEFKCRSWMMTSGGMPSVGLV